MNLGQYRHRGSKALLLNPGIARFGHPTLGANTEDVHQVPADLRAGTDPVLIEQVLGGVVVAASGQVKRRQQAQQRSTGLGSGNALLIMVFKEFGALLECDVFHLFDVDADLGHAKGGRLDVDQVERRTRAQAHQSGQFGTGIHQVLA